jgi:hydrogenase maturation protein HypF
LGRGTEGFTRYRLTISGVVQGVGFRPFVKRAADRLQLTGSVSNTAGGVVIELDTAHSAQLHTFLDVLHRERPPAARIERCTVEEVLPAETEVVFTIGASVAQPGAFTLISPDLAVCRDCVRETTDPRNRRYRYPFTNCTNCGPRYSITLSVPYDRVNTTMAPFRLCADCLREYGNPGDRRFHAEPNACPKCGPRLSMDLDAARAILARGGILALKSIGGFQLACDALNPELVRRLRERKRGNRKPFAVMMPDLATVRRYCCITPCEQELLTSAAAPIVLLPCRDTARFPPDVAPGLRELGVMLPYTPLHHLLFGDTVECLVVTSGNISEEPIVISNHEAHRVLGPVADVVLTHNRDILMRVDDSVVRTAPDGRAMFLRRARGYAPSPIDLGFDVDGILACGAELKNTFCLTRGRYAILSQHIGDMENLETLRFFEETLRNLKNVYRAEPRLITHDLHPDYMTTRWAEAQPLERIAVQHHHAHIAACMAENGVREPVIGIAFDGAGYGPDAHLWGGEFLICDYRNFQRAAHLRYVPMAGGDRTAREPYRMAAIHLLDAFGEDAWSLDLPPLRAAPAPFWKTFGAVVKRTQLMTSSCGRLFDAVSALAGVCQHSSYEGEAAMLLEAAAGRTVYEPVDLQFDADSIDTRPLIRELARMIANGGSPATISGVFHSSLAHLMRLVSVKLRASTGITKICLSGGTFQNCTLLSLAVPLLRREGFSVFLHSKVPANDGGISLGQAVIAAAIRQQRSE